MRYRWFARNENFKKESTLPNWDTWFSARHWQSTQLTSSSIFNMYRPHFNPRAGSEWQMGTWKDAYPTIDNTSLFGYHSNSSRRFIVLADFCLDISFVLVKWTKKCRKTTKNLNLKLLFTPLYPPKIKIDEWITCRKDFTHKIWSTLCPSPLPNQTMVRKIGEYSQGDVEWNGLRFIVFWEIVKGKMVEGKLIKRSGMWGMWSRRMLPVLRKNTQSENKLAILNCIKSSQVR